MADTSFHHSALDRIPHEIRNIIYGHLIDLCQSVVSHALEANNKHGAFRIPQVKRLPWLALAAKRFYKALVHDAIHRHQEVRLPYVFRCQQPMSSDYFPHSEDARHLSIIVGDPSLTVEHRVPRIYYLFSQWDAAYLTEQTLHWFNIPRCFPNLHSVSIEFRGRPPDERYMTLDGLEFLLHRSMMEIPSVKVFGATLLMRPRAVTVIMRC